MYSYLRIKDIKDIFHYGLSSKIREGEAFSSGIILCRRYHRIVICGTLLTPVCFVSSSISSKRRRYEGICSLVYTEKVDCV